MPSTRRQKAKARRSREMDMMSDFDNLDIIVGNENINPIERELANGIEESTVQYGIESDQRPMDNFHHEGDFGNISCEDNIPRRDEVLQSKETFTTEFNLRLSQEMDSMMSMMHSQINRAISSAISDRVIPEIRSFVSSMPSSGNKDTEVSSSPKSQENGEQINGLRSKISKKVSRSACDLRNLSPYNNPGHKGASEYCQLKLSSKDSKNCSFWVFF